MNMNLRKWSILFGLSMLFCVANISAYADGGCCPSDTSCRWDCCNDCPQLKPVQPCCDDCGFFAGADFLWWNTHQTNLDYAVDGVDGEQSSPSFISSGGLGKGKVHFMDYDWDAGFRVMAGYRLGCDGWDARVVYTYFHNKASGSTKARDTSGDSSYRQLLDPTLLVGDTKIKPKKGSEKAHCSTSLDYDVVDLLFSRPFCLSETVIARPFFGVRAVWLDQTLSAKYEGGGSGSSSPGPRTVKWDGDWEGIGVNCGMEHNVHFIDGWSI